MLGTDYEPGIMARALNDLFDAMDAESEDSVYKVTMSYLEVLQNIETHLESLNQFNRNSQ